MYNVRLQFVYSSSRCGEEGGGGGADLLVFELDGFGDGHTILGDFGSSEGLVDHYVPTPGTEGDLVPKHLGGRAPCGYLVNSSWH